MVDIKKSWDKISSLYCRKYKINTDTVHYGPLCPGEKKLQLLGDLNNKRVLDLGCGAGQNCIAFAKLGAQAIGLDISAGQLLQAKKLADMESISIEFISADMTSLPFSDKTKFDIVFSACACAFVKDIKKVFRQSYRLLVPRGMLVVSVMHPVQYIIDGDENGMSFNSKYPAIQRLLKWSWDIEGEKIRFQHYLRSISAYHNAITAAGFRMSRIMEPLPTLKTPHIDFSREIMREYPYIASHLPVTLILAAVKN